MKTLWLLRHAKSSWDDASLDDFYRPLNERGRRSARAIGQYLAERGVKFDLILASPAERVAETLKGLAKGGWRSGPIQFDEAIYHATARDLIELIRSAPKNAGRLMLVGHNPAIGELAVQLTAPDAHGLRAEASTKFPTGALAAIELDIDSWADAGAECGRMVEFRVPRSLPAA